MATAHFQPILAICCGVSGSGKSTLAKNLATQLQWPMVEADDFHSKLNKQHMASGKPLNDVMREPWMQSIESYLQHMHRIGRSCVLAHSGLKKQHRNRLRNLGFKTVFFHLNGSEELLRDRLNSRNGHFMPSNLLASQIKAFEPIGKEENFVKLCLSQPLDVATAIAKDTVNILRYGQEVCLISEPVIEVA